MNVRQVLMGLSMLPLLACAAEAPEDTSIDDPPAAVVAGTTVSYAVDSASIFANPERGFYHHREARSSAYEPLDQAELTKFRTQEGVSLVLRMLYLDSFRSSSISAACSTVTKS